jgi:hypothetical protein
MATTLWCLAVSSAALSQHAGPRQSSNSSATWSLQSQPLPSLRAGDVVVFFVAVNGSSSANGRTPQTALRTVEEARDAVRTARGTSGSGVPAEIRVRRFLHSNAFIAHSSTHTEIYSIVHWRRVPHNHQSATNPARHLARHMCPLAHVLILSHADPWSRDV